MSEIVKSDHHDEKPTGEITTQVVKEPEIDLAAPYLEIVKEFSERQRELLRLAEYVSEREHEIDDRKAAAIKRVKRVYPDATLEVIEPRWEKISVFLTRMASKDVDREMIEEELSAVISDIPEGYGVDFITALMQAKAETPSSPRLLSSLLTALIGDFEVMVAGLVRQLISLHPQILASENVKYDWKQVSAFGSLEMFQEDVIEKTVDGVLFGSFNDWMDFFAKRCHIQIPALANTYVVQEVFQRRHVTVHNGAKVSRLYLDKLKNYKRPKGTPASTVGAELLVDLDYLNAAADALSVLAVTLVGNCANKFLKEPADRFRVERIMGDYPYQLIKDGRYQCSYEISCEQDLDSFSDDYTALVVKVNSWLALKRLGKLPDYRAEIEAWQTSALKTEFRLAQLALLDEEKEAYALVLELRGTESLPYHFWLSWPLLEELRSYEANLTKSQTADV